MTSSRRPESASTDSGDRADLAVRTSRRARGPARRSRSRKSLSGAERLRRRREGFVDALRDFQGEAETEVGWAPRSGGWVLLAVSVAVGFALSRALPRALPSEGSPREPHT